MNWAIIAIIGCIHWLPPQLLLPPHELLLPLLFPLPPPGTTGTSLLPLPLAFSFSFLWPAFMAATSFSSVSNVRRQISAALVSAACLVDFTSPAQSCSFH